MHCRTQLHLRELLRHWVLVIELHVALSGGSIWNRINSTCALHVRSIKLPTEVGGTLASQLGGSGNSSIWYSSAHRHFAVSPRVHVRAGRVTVGSRWSALSARSKRQRKAALLLHHFVDIAL